MNKEELKEFMDDLWKNDPVFKRIDIVGKISWCMFVFGIVGLLIYELLIK